MVSTVSIGLALFESSCKRYTYIAVAICISITLPISIVPSCLVRLCKNPDLTAEEREGKEDECQDVVRG
jgi:hypothetical protein